jgi:hypothetical protein
MMNGQKLKGQMENGQILNGQNDRQKRLLKKTQDKVLAEERNIIELLKQRSDYRPEFDYFLSLLTNKDSQAVEKRTHRPVMALLCKPAPL